VATYNIIDQDGNIIGFIDNDTEAAALLDQVPPEEYVFYLGGSKQDVDRTITALNKRDNSQPSFFDLLKNKYGAVPNNINPFDELRDIYLKDSATFIKVKDTPDRPNVLGQLLGTLNATIPAGTTFCTIIEKPEISEVFPGAISEGIDIWYALDVIDSGVTVNENILTAVT